MNDRELMKRIRFSKAEWRRVRSAAAKKKTDPVDFLRTAAAESANQVLDGRRPIRPAFV
jgi:uncharacterized protein (DUF1778 family)